MNRKTLETSKSLVALKKLTVMLEALLMTPRNGSPTELEKSAASKVLEESITV